VTDRPDSLFARAEPLVARALGFDAAARDAWVAEACAGDPALEAEVRALVRLAARAPDFLTGTAFDDLAREQAAVLRPDALVGQRIGPYRLDALVGSGGMADVFRAHHHDLARTEALKIFPAGGDPAAARVIAEARAASALNHPNVVTTFAVGEADGWHFIAMEWLDGETLRARVARGPVPAVETADMAVQLAAALVAAHRAGIVHRDLKPENVIVTPAGRLKVLDFGIAARTGHDARPVAAGTGGYMAPEQAAGDPAGPASDQYAFGVMLHEMLTGQRPPAAGLGETPASTGDADADVLIRRCVRRDPASRYPTTGALAVATHDWLDRRRRAGLTRRRLLQAAGLAAAAGVAGWTWWPDPAPRRIAVLPFRNTSGDPAADYLAGGLPATLIERLAAFPALHVLPRTLMANFGEGAGAPREVGQRLGADLVLSGTVTAVGTSLAVTADLLDVPSGRTLFSTRYDEPATGLLAVEERLAKAIVDRGIGTRLSPPRERRAAHPGTTDARAYDLYLRAVHLCEQESESGYAAARGLLDEALARDPRFGPGHVQMAATFVQAALDGYERPTEAWPQSSRHVRLAIDANPDAADAYASAAAQDFFFTWDWDAAEASWRRAMRFDGADLHPDLHTARSLQRAALGRFDEALALARDARRIDPVSPMFAVREADLLVYLGRLDDAIAAYESVLTTSPRDPRALFGLADALRAAGRLEDAVLARHRAHALAQDLPDAAADALDQPAEELARLDRLSAEAELGALRARAFEGRYVSPLDAARQYARRGDYDAAARQFESALADRAPGLTMLDVDRAWDGMRADPRFRQLRERVGLP